jgi:hypothetical protein
MAASSLNDLTVVSAASLRKLLTEEHDAHRRQRELVRASLGSCPGKPRPSVSRRD